MLYWGPKRGPYSRQLPMYPDSTYFGVNVVPIDVLRDQSTYYYYGPGHQKVNLIEGKSKHAKQQVLLLLSQDTFIVILSARRP